MSYFGAWSFQVSRLEMVSDFQEVSPSESNKEPQSVEVKIAQTLEIKGLMN